MDEYDQMRANALRSAEYQRQLKQPYTAFQGVPESRNLSVNPMTPLGSLLDTITSGSLFTSTGYPSGQPTSGPLLDSLIEFLQKNNMRTTGPYSED